MRLENPSDYVLIGFEVATDNKYKYKAILRNKFTNRERKVPFGAKGYQHYYDQIGFYKKYNHLDKERRKRYRLRHAGEEKYKYSSGYFSWKYLW